MSSTKPPRAGWFYAGLFFTTLATLSLELLNTRVLSVAAWYHLAFFAVSTAMFGMSAGAIHVYLRGHALDEAQSRQTLFRSAMLLAVAIPVAHLATLCIPMQSTLTVMTIASVAFVTITIAIPFFISGVTVAIALTRIPGPSGLVYAVDLIGAALGSILVLPLLKIFDVSSATIICGGIAALGAWCFGVFANETRPRRFMAGLAIVLVGLAFLNRSAREGIRVVHIKGGYVPSANLLHESWTIHGRVDVGGEAVGKPPYWGPGKGTEGYKVAHHGLRIDGDAGTPITKWDGKVESLEWIKHDVTTLAYHLRKNGNAGIIGVGGGRDVLTAIWARSQRITGIEINEVQLRHLRGPFRAYAGIADRPEIQLVHDEARSYLTRTSERFDVLQMSLIDTWAATGAGAFTLSENGLYTREAWRVFLNTLQPKGIFTVSRWYTPGRDSETSRLVSLAVASLLDRGVADPSQCMAVVARGSIATLLLSPDAFDAQDLEQLKKTAETYGFTILLAPNVAPSNAWLSRVMSVRANSDFELRLADPDFDYLPPTDARPFFFNMLKPHGLVAKDLSGATLNGNLLATRTLILLWLLSLVLVVTTIVGPLVRSGLPKLERRSFGQAVLYFAGIGVGFMWVQIPLMQRFSVYLGHPTYAVAIILFSMILATGLGSWLSDRLPLERQGHWVLRVPLLIAMTLLVASFAIQPLIHYTISANLPVRAMVVVLFVSIVAFPLGFCFPMGLRLVKRLSSDALPWMWGINGAAGVLASASAVGISMWASIDTNLHLALVTYALLAIPAWALWKKGQEGNEGAAG